MAPCSFVEIYRHFGDRCVSPLVQEDFKFISEYRPYISDDSSIHCQPREKLTAHNYVTMYFISTAHITYKRVYFCLICGTNFTRTATNSASFTINRPKATENFSTQQYYYFTVHKKNRINNPCVLSQGHKVNVASISSVS